MFANIFFLKKFIYLFIYSINFCNTISEKVIMQIINKKFDF